MVSSISLYNHLTFFSSSTSTQSKQIQLFFINRKITSNYSHPLNHPSYHLFPSIFRSWPAQQLLILLSSLTNDIPNSVTYFIHPRLILLNRFNNFDLLSPSSSLHTNIYSKTTIFSLFTSHYYYPSMSNYPTLFTSPNILPSIHTNQGASPTLNSFQLVNIYHNFNFN